MNRVGCKGAKIVFFENESNRQLFVKEKIVKKNQTHCLNGAGVDLEKFQFVIIQREILLNSFLWEE